MSQPKYTVVTWGWGFCTNNVTTLTLNRSQGKIMKKSIAALALAGSMALAGAGTATAARPAPYPAPSTGTTVSNTVTTPGGTIVLTVATGFQPGETVRITVTFNGVTRAAGGNVNGGASRTVPLKITMPSQTVVDSFTLTANAQGGFSTPVTLGTEEGDYTITAVGLTSGFSISQTVTVDDGVNSVQPAGSQANASSGTGLANTGADSGLVLWSIVGAGALALGATSVVVVRRRAKDEVAA